MARPMGTTKAKPSMWLWLMRGGNLDGQASTTSEDPKNRGGCWELPKQNY